MTRFEEVNTILGCPCTEMTSAAQFSFAIPAVFGVQSFNFVSVRIDIGSGVIHSYVMCGILG